MKKLHLGCGSKLLKGYINVDVREETNCDVIDNISKLSKFKNNDVDVIYACHVLEHFTRAEYKNVLGRFKEVLKDGGTLRLAVPDFKQISNLYNKKEYTLKQLMGLLYGGQTYAENFHYVAFDFVTLKKDLEELGFKNIQRWDWREVDHGHIDDYSQAYLPHMDKDNGVLMSLNIEATA
jgi:ubiquinone/menaquinone biosynthesis C-methylase UbiE